MGQHLWRAYSVQALSWSLWQHWLKQTLIFFCCWMSWILPGTICHVFKPGTFFFVKLPIIWWCGERIMNFSSAAIYQIIVLFPLLAHCRHSQCRSSRQNNTFSPTVVFFVCSFLFSLSWMKYMRPSTEPPADLVDQRCLISICLSLDFNFIIQKNILYRYGFGYILWKTSGKTINRLFFKSPCSKTKG